MLDGWSGMTLAGKSPIFTLLPVSRRSDNGLPSIVALNDSLELQLLLTSENSMQGENYEHSWIGTCPCTSSTWRSFGLAQRMAAWSAVSQRSGVIRDKNPQQTPVLDDFEFGFGVTQ